MCITSFSLSLCLSDIVSETVPFECNIEYEYECFACGRSLLLTYRTLDTHEKGQMYTDLASISLLARHSLRHM